MMDGGQSMSFSRLGSRGRTCGRWIRSRESIQDPASSRILGRNLNVSFAGSDVVTGLDGKYKDPAVANLAGAGGFDDRLDRVVHEVLVDDEFNHDFGQ